MARPAPEIPLTQQMLQDTRTLARLTPQERAVYDVLEDNAGRVLSRAEIARRAGLADLSQRRCDSLIVGIRRRLGPDRVRTVRRRGWMLVD